MLFKVLHIPLVFPHWLVVVVRNGNINPFEFLDSRTNSNKFLRPRRLLDIWSKKIDIMGFSIICDHNGNVLVHANSTSEYKNDLITQSVVLDRNQKKRDPIQWRGQRKDKDNVSIFSRVLTKICLSNFLGKTYYFLSLKRRRKALEIAKRTHMSYHELDSKRHKHKPAKFYLLIIFGSLAVFGLYILGKRQYDRFTGLLPIF